MCIICEYTYVYKEVLTVSTRKGTNIYVCSYNAAKRVQDLQHLFRCFLSSPLLETNLRKPNTMETSIRELLKPTLGSRVFFAGLRHSGPQNHKFDKLVCVDASSSKNIQKPVVFVNYHFLWSTHKSVQQPQQATIVYGRLKIQTTTVLHRYFESRQCRVREWEREREREREKKIIKKKREREREREKNKDKEKKRKRKRKRKKNRKKETEIFWMIPLFAERFSGKNVEVKLVLRYICKIIQHPSSSQNGST